MNPAQACDTASANHGHPNKDSEVSSVREQVPQVILLYGKGVSEGSGG